MGIAYKATLYTPNGLPDRVVLFFTRDDAHQWAEAAKAANPRYSTTVTQWPPIYVGEKK